jgi:hypothetical protein
MIHKIASLPLIQHPKAWWIPFISLGITLFGIFYRNWNVQPIVYFFWWEVILMIGAALIRMLFAMDNQPITAHLFQKIGLLLGGILMGSMFVMLSVAFTFKAFENIKSGSLSGMSTQVRLLQISYVLGLCLHFFANGRYKTASPSGELMSVFVHLLVLLALLMALTMHLIPKFPQLNQVIWIAVALVLVKFFVDLLFAKIRLPLTDKVEKNPDNFIG